MSTSAYLKLRRKSTIRVSHSQIPVPFKRLRNLSLKLKTISRRSTSASASFPTHCCSSSSRSVQSNKKRRLMAATLSRNFLRTTMRWRFDKLLRDCDPLVLLICLSVIRSSSMYHLCGLLLFRDKEEENQFLFLIYVP